MKCFVRGQLWLAGGLQTSVWPASCTAQLENLTLRAYVHVIISMQTLTITVKLRIRVRNWARPRSKVVGSLLLPFLSSSVALRISSVYYGAAVSAPSLLNNEGFPIWPNPNAELININRYSFTEQKSPEIRHKYWWLVSDKPLKSARRFDGPYSKPNPMSMGEVNLV